MSGPSLTVYPEHVAVGYLITALISPPLAEKGWGVGFDGATAQRQLALFLLEELQDSSSPTLSSVPSLLTRLPQALGPAAGTALATLLITSLHDISTPDDMVNMTASFGGFLAPPGTPTRVPTEASNVPYITTTSPLGLFLRRLRLGLSSMSLDGLSALADKIQDQAEEAADQLLLQEQQQQQQQQQPQDDDAPQHGAAQQRDTCTTGDSSSSSSSGALKEPAVVDAYLNTLLAAVKSLGTCLPAATIQAAVAPLAELQDSNSKLQYLDLALSIAHKDLSAALSALHQYFDRSGSSSGTIPGTSIPAPAGSSKASKGQHQAALHNLASLQMSLGHPQEALAALQELLRLGQQQGDEWSLLHGLASLCRVMGASEGLQDSSSSSSGSSGSNAGSGPGGWAGWGLLDLRRTEQQLQLQALLQRCLDSARDMHVPHIAAYAAVALCRYRMTHASSNSSSGSLEGVSAVPGVTGEGAAGSGAASTAATAAGTSLTVQRMLLDVATIEHQSSIAAAAPHAPITVAGAPRMDLGHSAQPTIVPAAWASELYNPTQVFGTGTSTAAPGVNVLAGALSARAQAAGTGWRSSAAAVSQALATGNVLAAAALQLQGAAVLSGVRALMVLNGPGGAGVHDAAIAAAIPAAAAAAAAVAAVAEQSGAAEGQAGGDGSPAAAAAVAAAAVASRAAGGRGLSTAALTGSSVHCDDVAAAWVQLLQLTLELQGVAAARHVLTLAESHFPREAPQQLAVMREVVRLKAALQTGDFTEGRLACDELQGLAPAVRQLGLELQLVAAEAHVQLLHASGCFAEAHAAAAALFATAAGAGMQPQAVTALLLMGKACLAAGDAAGGLPYALSALLHCQVLQFDRLLPEAVLQVATAWQVLAPDGGQFVLQLLQQVLPLAHAEGRLEVRAQLEEGIAKLQLALSQGQVSAAAGSGSGNATQQGAGGQAAAAAQGAAAGVVVQPGVSCVDDVRQRLQAAASMLQQAGEVKPAAACWLLLAHVCNAAGLEKDRNAAAVRWQLCRQQCGAAQQQQSQQVVT